MLALLVVFPATAGYALTIRFHREVTVATPFVHLKDIAEISAGDPDAMERLRSAKLIPSPPGGGQLNLDFEAVRSRLTALGFSTANIEFTGASQIQVRGASGNVSAQPTQSGDLQPTQNLTALNRARRIVQNVVRNFVVEQPGVFEVNESEIEVRIPDRDLNLLGESNPQDWAIDTWSQKSDQVSHLVLRSNRAPIGAEPLRIACEVRMPPLALTVREPLSIGHIVQRDDLMWLYSGQAKNPARPEDVIGMETKTRLMPGVAIEVEDLQRKVYVRARDIVSVTARRGAISVKTNMRAVQSGGLGETIPLVPLKGNEKIFARVTGFHTAEVVDSPAPIEP